MDKVTERLWKPRRCENLDGFSSLERKVGLLPLSCCWKRLRLKIKIDNRITRTMEVGFVKQYKALILETYENSKTEKGRLS